MEETTSNKNLSVQDFKDLVLKEIKPYGYTIKDFINTPRDMLETIELENLHLMTFDVLKEIVDSEESHE